MVKVPTKPFDPAEFVETPEDAAIFLSDALESGDPAVIATSLGVIARAQGASNLALKAGLSRASLYSALSEGGNPTLATVMKIIDAVDLRLSAQPKRPGNVIPFHVDEWKLEEAA